MIIRTTGRILLFEAIMLLLPLITSFIYNENTWPYFLASIGVLLIFGGIMTITPIKDTKIL